MSFFLGIDLGTSYFKAGIFDETGKLHGLGRQAVEKNRNGASCELPVTVFWNTLRLCIENAKQQAQIVSKDILALSYSSQTNSFILLDDADKSLTPLILWPDERVQELPASLLALTQKADFLANTGLGIPPGRQSMIAKIDWFQKNQPRIWEKVKSVMSISDYLVFMLTGERISDFSTSSMTGLFSVPNRQWWPEALDLFGLKGSHLSTPVKTGALIGHISSKGVEYTGLSPKTLLFAGGLDHHLAAIGAGAICSNHASESTGTVLACVNYQEGYYPRASINVAPGLDDKHYFQMAFSANGAVALEEYQKNHAPKLTIPELLQLAENIEPGSKGSSHGHCIREILESTALSLLELVKKLEQSSEIRTIIPTGGGAQSRLWLQIKANILNKTFLVPESNELACKGAAMLCATGTSTINDYEFDKR